ncbi:MAG: TrkA family potassium uptake protein [Bdellovibrionales bacterium]|nr:TrkA family potassium uptake protein [Bdellovibrionales bacterium]
MRAIIIGASAGAVAAARILIEKKHEVIFIDIDKEKIESLRDKLDSGFLLGDGSTPELLKEANPKNTHTLFCLTDNDQVNIIASLVGRSLGFERVVTKIEDKEFVHICSELGLEDTIIPSETFGKDLAEVFEGHHGFSFSAKIKGEGVAMSFVIKEGSEGNINDLLLSQKSRIVCYYRNNKFYLPEENTEFKTGDEVVLVTHEDEVSNIQDNFLK